MYDKLADTALRKQAVTRNLRPIEHLSATPGESRARPSLDSRHVCHSPKNRQGAQTIQLLMPFNPTLLGRGQDLWLWSILTVNPL